MYTLGLMNTTWFERSVITDRAVLLCERARMLRAQRLADATLEIGGGLACRRSTHTWPNVVGGFEPGRAISQDEIERLIAWFGEIGKAARLEISDRAGVPTFAVLGAAGFRLKDLVSILTLEIADGVPPPSLPHGVRIAMVSPDDAPACRRLAEVVTQQFAVPGTQADPSDIAANDAGFRHPDSLALGAFDGDTCVGGAFFDVADGVAALWGAAVHTNYRRRGVQQALMAHRLKLAREMGASLAFIETSSGGPTQRNASALGFELAYTRANMFRPHG